MLLSSDYLDEQWQSGFKSQHSMLYIINFHDFFVLILKREMHLFLSSLDYFCRIVTENKCVLFSLC